MSGLQVCARSRWQDAGRRTARFSTAGREAEPLREYTRQEAMIPMRDGVRLHAVILRPRTKGRRRADAAVSDRPDALRRRGVRFRRASTRASRSWRRAGTSLCTKTSADGTSPRAQFVMNRPVVVPHSKSDVDETTDTYDTIDWLLKNVPGNKRPRGRLGVSYDGFLAMRWRASMRIRR
jgi:predicted acyl esterase